MEKMFKFSPYLNYPSLNCPDIQIFPRMELKEKTKHCKFQLIIGSIFNLTILRIIQSPLGSIKHLLSVSGPWEPCQNNQQIRCRSILSAPNLCQLLVRTAFNLITSLHHSWRFVSGTLRAQRQARYTISMYLNDRELMPRFPIQSGT